MRPASESTLSGAMLFHQSDLDIETHGRSSLDLTAALQSVVRNANVSRGLCTIFVHHTSASLMVCENADAAVRSDLERFFSKLVPDGDPLFKHTDEGPDDMPSHVRSILTQTSIGLPIRDGKLDLGVWQGIYLYEHRHAPHRRRISVTIVGEPA
jgi:secondary thiamine-phosphate synthase enzyme